MFADHQAKVFQKYQQLKAEGPLSTNLKVPAPAKLRNECEKVLDKRFSKDDKEILSSYFGEQSDRAGYVTAINNFDIDLFRPLESFMKGKVKKPDPKHVELLAWLIDYSPRPYRVDDLYHVFDLVDLKKDEQTVQKPRIDEPDDNLNLGQSPIKKLPVTIKSCIAAFILLILGLIGFQIFRNVGKKGVQGCMYWIGDQYKPISCNEKPADTTAMVIGLDSYKLLHFKRITRADTLTAASIGKVWYIKLNDDIEFYTAPGEPPAHPGRRLLPLTAHILDVHPRHPG